MKSSPLDNLLLTLGQDLKSPTILLQIAVVLLSLAIGWALSSRFMPKLSSDEHAGWKLGWGGLARVAFPAIALVCLLVGKIFFGRAHPTAILNVALSLLTAFALVRLAVYMLRHAFPPHPLLRASERFIVFVLWFSVALYIIGLDEPVLAYLEEPVRFGTRHFSLLAVLTAMGSVIVTLIAALWLAQLTESRLMGATTLDMSLRVVLSKFSRALLLMVAVLIALSLAGIDLTVLSVFGGALGVGLGFGLQKVASNYVSGFIILLDRSIRPGDLITADNRYGTVSQLNTRYTVVKGMDGSEAIIPNDTLMTTTVINHSYTDERILIKLAVQVAYQSPLEEALSLLVAAANGEPRVLKEPAALAVVQRFAENGIDLELLFWIADPQNGDGALRSNIFLAIWRAFQERGIEIPYPQRDLRIVTVPSAWAAALGSPDTGKES